MSSVDLSKNSGNQSTAHAVLASNPFASLAEDEDGGVGSPTLIPQGGSATAETSTAPSIRKYPGHGLTRQHPADEPMNTTTRVNARLMVDHPTAEGKTFAFNIGSSPKGAFISSLTPKGTYRGCGYVADLIEDGTTKYYVDPFKGDTVWLYDLTLNGHTITFFDFRWNFLNFYKRDRDPAISEWATHLISAIKSKTSVYLDDQQMFRTHFRNKKAPVIKGGWSKPKRTTASSINTASTAVAAVASEQPVHKAKVVKPKPVAKPVAKSKPTPKPAPASASSESTAVKLPKKGGPHGTKFVAIERGHGIATLYDEETDRYTFTKEGKPFSRAEMNKAGFKVTPTPAGFIVYDNSVDKAISSAQKRHLFSETLLWQSKNGDPEATRILQENWPTIFSVKHKLTKKWTWSQTAFIKLDDATSVASASASEVDTVEPDEVSEDGEAVEVPIAKTVTFDYSKALKTKPPIKPKPAIKSERPEPPSRPAPTLKPETEAFPALPEMTEEQRQEQVKAKKEHAKRIAEEKRNILEAKAKAEAEENERKAEAEAAELKAKAEAEAAERKALAEAQAADPLHQACQKAKSSKAPVKLEGAALAALLGL